MRAFLLAAIAGLGLAAAGDATARVWTDPEGRIVFDAPAGWTVTREQVDGFTYAIAGNADNECHFLAMPRDNLANISARDARRAAANDAQFTRELWAGAANAVGPVFPNDSANVLSNSAEHEPFFPIQRAEIQAPERLVHSALQVRPGLELMTFCQTFEGTDPIATYDSVIRSVGHPNDATWRAEAEAQQVEREAQEAAAAAAAAAAAPAQGSRRNRRDQPGD